MAFTLDPDAEAQAPAHGQFSLDDLADTTPSVPKTAPATKPLKLSLDDLADAPDPSSQGQLVPGNVDLAKQPKVKNDDGTYSTVDSQSFNIDGHEVLLPRVTPDGRHLKDPKEVLAEYRKTGRHLGIFASPADADAYAQKLHEDYASGKYGAMPADARTKQTITVGGVPVASGAFSDQEAEAIGRLGQQTAPHGVALPKIGTPAEGPATRPPDGQMHIGPTDRVTETARALKKDVTDLWDRLTQAPLVKPVDAAAARAEQRVLAAVPQAEGSLETAEQGGYRSPEDVARASATTAGAARGAVSGAAGFVTPLNVGLGLTGKVATVLSSTMESLSEDASILRSMIRSGTSAEGAVAGAEGAMRPAGQMGAKLSAEELAVAKERLKDTLARLGTLEAAKSAIAAGHGLAGAGITSEGAYRLITAPTWGEKAQGVAEMAGGGAMLAGGVQAATKPIPLTQAIVDDIRSEAATRVAGRRVPNEPAPAVTPTEAPAAAAAAPPDARAPIGALPGITIPEAPPDVSSDHSAVEAPIDTKLALQDYVAAEEGSDAQKTAQAALQRAGWSDDHIVAEAGALAEHQARVTDGTADGGGHFTADDLADETSAAPTPNRAQMLEQQIAAARAAGREDLPAVRALQELRAQQQPEKDDTPAKPKFASTQMNVPEPLATGLRRLAGRVIAPEDLTNKGAEHEPHVTVKFGLHDDDPATIQKLRDLVSPHEPITATLGKTSVFPDSGQGDVVKLGVDSPELHALNAKIAEAFPHTDTHPDYQPHVTLAYVKPGKGKDYEGDASLDGQQVTFNDLTFSTKSGEKITIPLTGHPTEVSQDRADAPMGTEGAPLSDGKAVPPAARSTTDQKFLDTYVQALADARKANPDAYVWPESQALSVAEKMLPALASGGAQVNHSPALKQAAKTLGIKNTVKGWKDWFHDNRMGELADKWAEDDAAEAATVDHPRRNASDANALEAALSPKAQTKLAEMFKARNNAKDLRHIREAMEVYERLLESEAHKTDARALKDAAEAFFTNPNRDTAGDLDAAAYKGLQTITGEEDPDPAELLENEVFASAREAGHLIFNTLDPKTASFDVEEFNTAFGTVEFRRPQEDVFPKPKQVVNDHLKLNKDLISQEAADQKIAEWKAEAKRIGREEDHSNETVFSLFDTTGVWSQPYVDAGYNVKRFDIQNGNDLMDFGSWMDQVEEEISEGREIVGILGAPPCTSFAVSGARWWKSQHDVVDESMVAKKYGLWASKHFERPLDYANTLVAVMKLIVEQANPSQFYAMENPIGRIAEQNALPKPTLTFDPANFGNPYTKQTQIWGDFNPDLPMANVDPTLGSLMHKLRGDVEEDKAKRSETPEGFAYAFFMANHQAPVATTAGAYDAEDLSDESETGVESEKEEADVEQPGSGVGAGQLPERDGATARPIGTLSQDALAEVSAEPDEEAERGGAAGAGHGDSESVVADAVPRGTGTSEGSETELAPSGSDVPESMVVPPSGATHDPGTAAPDYALTPERIRSVIDRGPVARAEDNLRAIKLVKQLAAEQRYATVDEQDVLAKYVGFGASDMANRLGDHPKHDWSANEKRIWEEFNEILTPEERHSLARSTPNAHYTYDLYQPIWNVLERAGFAGGRVLEPAVGTGHAFGFMPPDIRQNSTLNGVELETFTAAIAHHLYPSARIQAVGYEEARIARGTQDLIISNVPFLEFGVKDSKLPDYLTEKVHNYFFAKAMDHVRPGGLVVFVTTRYTMDGTDSERVRKYLSDNADFLGAVRLPNTAFDKSAKTEVITDIIVLRRRADGQPESPNNALFVPSKISPLSTKDGYDARGRWQQGKNIYRSGWYDAHPELVLGDETLEGTMYGANEYTVTGHKGEIGPAIEKALGDVLPRDSYTEPVAEPSTDFKPAKKRAEPQMVEGTYKPGELRVGPKNTILRVSADGEIADVTPKNKKGDPDLVASMKIARMVAIRDARNLLVVAMRDPNVTDAEVKKRQKALRDAYDTFVKPKGKDPNYLNKAINKRLFKDDPEATNLLGLEVVETKASEVTNKAGQKVLKLEHKVIGVADIFTKRTILAEPEITSVDTPTEAMLVSLGVHGRLDWPYMAKLAGVSPMAIKAALKHEGHVFEQPDGSYVMAEEYLSGDVVTKLEDVQAMHEPKRFQTNIDALTAVQPAPKTREDIAGGIVSVGMGAHWVPPNDLRDFVAEQLGVGQRDVKFRIFGTETMVRWEEQYSREAEQASNRHVLAVKYTPDARGEPTQTYGFLKLVSDALNLAQPELGHWTGSGDNKQWVKEPVATLAARANQESLRAAWMDYVYSHPELQDRVLKIFNTRYNRTVERKFDGSYMKYPGMAQLTNAKGDVLSFFPHQNNGVHRILMSGNTLLAHEVGAGKTFEMIAAAMRMRQTGRATKPMITVPTYLLSQWRQDIIRLYPTAKLLAFDETDLASDKRQVAMSRIAHGDWDIVLVPHSSFELLKVSDARLVKQMQDWIEELKAAEKAEGKNSDNVKEMEKQRRRIEKKVQKKMDKLNKGTDNALTWEQLGVDALMVDEAQAFKNLFFFSKIENLRGLSKSESDRSLDLFVKVQDINEQSGHRNIVLATATPVMNSISEIYTMQRYLQPQALRQYGVENFDNWYAMFAKALPTTERQPDGSYKEVMRLREYQNLQLLSKMIRGVMDYIGWEDMPYLKLPKIADNRIEIVETPQHPMYPILEKWFTQRMDALRANPPHVKRDGTYVAPDRLDPITGEVMVYRAGEHAKHAAGEPKKDNIITVMADAKKAAVDVRLIFGDRAKDFEGSRVNKAADLMFEICKKETPKKGVQLMFLDMGVPNAETLEPLNFLQNVTTEDETEGEFDEAAEEPEGDDEEGLFNLYDAVKKALIKRGVPAKEIAYIHQARNSAERVALFQAANEGKVRFVFASTDKGGVGMNIQTRLAAIHELDAPRFQRPGDLRQRMGRGVRQGNTYDEIRLARYVTKGTTDEWLWGLMTQKDYQLRKFYRGEASNMTEDDPSTMSLEEAQIRATNDPRGVELTELKGRMARLEAQASAGERGMAAAKADLSRGQTNLKNATRDLADLNAWLPKFTTLRGDKFSMKVGGTTYAKRAEAEAALLAVLRPIVKNEVETSTTVGELGGVPVFARYAPEFKWKTEKSTEKVTIPVASLSLDGAVYGGDTMRAGAAVQADLDDRSTLGKGQDIIAMLVNAYETIPRFKSRHEEDIEKAKAQIEQNERTLANPPSAMTALVAARARITQIETELREEGEAKATERREEARIEAERKAAEKNAKPQGSVSKSGRSSDEPDFSVAKGGPDLAPVFYSQLQRVITNKMPAKAPADQILNLVKNAQSGVKADELKWSGLEPWLREQNGSVTKADVLAFLAANSIRIDEVRLGDDAEEMGRLAESHLPIGSPEDQRYMRLVDESKPTKFANYQTPGGENYRELLLTLPASKPVGPKVPDGAGGLVAPTVAAGWQNIAGGFEGTGGFQGNFESGHFDEPNVLVHVRFNDRTDADGKKVLFLEEVQSDWHQKGRREGYQTKQSIVGWTAKVGAKGDRGDIYEVSDETGTFLNNVVANSPEEAIWRESAARARRPSLVPDAPFKTTWQELAVKRMLRYAAEHGYDKLAWTTGEQQNERYDLSKQVSEIYAEPVPVVKQGGGGGEIRYELTAVDNKGETFFDSARTGPMTIEHVAETVGKEMAEKIKDLKGPHSFKGLELKIGGSGMKGFYDDILPRFVNKYVKAWGAKVGEVTIKAGFTAGMDENDPNRWRVGMWDGVYHVYRPLEGTDFEETTNDEGTAPETFSTWNVATLRAGTENMAERVPKKERVHAVDITPAMKASVLHEGQPQFQATKGEQPSQAIEAKARHDAYAQMPLVTIGDRVVPVYDTSHKLTPLEFHGLLRNPAVKAVSEAILRANDRVLEAVLGPEKRNEVERSGLLFDKNLYGVYYPGGSGKATILINPFEYMRENQQYGPREVAHQIVATLVHEATHNEVAGHEQDFLDAYARNLETLGAQMFQLEDQIAEAYGESGTRRHFRDGLAQALHVYSDAQGRPGTPGDPLGRAFGYSQRSANERGESDEAVVGAGSDRSATPAGLGAHRVADLLTQERGSVASGVLTLPATLAKSVLEKDRNLLMAVFAPDLTSRAAEVAAGSLSAHIAAKDQKVERVKRLINKIEAAMDGWSHDQSMTFWDVMEGTIPDTEVSPDVAAIADLFRSIQQPYTHELIERGLIKNYIEHYWHHEWEQGTVEVNFVRRMLGRRPLAGNENYRKQRTIPTMREGIEEYGKTPRDWNPARQLMISISQQARSIQAFDFRVDMHENGLRKFVPITRKAPEGWVKDEDYGVVFGPREVSVLTSEGDIAVGKPTFGKLVAGQYWMPAEVYRLVKNHTSRGLYGRSTAWDIYRKVGNLFTQVLLGWSGFHLKLTGIESIISKQALVAELIARGEVGEALKKQKDVGPHGLIKDLVRGRQIVKAFYKDDADASSVAGIIGQIVQGGGGFGWSELEHENAPAKFMRDIRGVIGAVQRLDAPTAAQKIGAAAWHGAFAVNELPINLIMTHWVPYLKASAFMDMAEMELRRLEKEGKRLDLNEVRRVLRARWKAVDDRFGQLRYDNLFWNNSLKQALTGSFLSLGWQVGSLRHLMGAPLGQTARIAQKLAKAAGGGGGKGKPPAGTPGGAAGESEGPQEPLWQQAPNDPFLHHKAAWFITGAILIGLAGAIYQYAMTGEGPRDQRDLWTPRNGDVDANGREQRDMTISYAKDWYAWTHHPITTLENKLQSILHLMYETYANEDFYGVQVRNPDDPLVQQVGEVMASWGSRLDPIAWAQASQRAGLGASRTDKFIEWAKQQANPFQPAPAEFERSKAEDLLVKWGAQDHRVKTQEQAADSKLTRAIREGVKAGTPAGKEAAAAAIQTGKLSAGQIRAAERGGLRRQTYLQYGFEQQPLDRALTVYETATPEERRTLRALLVRKAYAAQANLPAATRGLVIARYRKALALPMEK